MRIYASRPKLQRCDVRVTEVACNKVVVSGALSVVPVRTSSYDAKNCDLRHRGCLQEGPPFATPSFVLAGAARACKNYGTFADLPLPLSCKSTI